MIPLSIQGQNIHNNPIMAHLKYKFQKLATSKKNKQTNERENRALPAIIMRLT